MRVKSSKNGRFISPSEESVREFINNNFPEWEYVGGYTHSDSKITIRCRTCGTEIQKSFTSMRHRKPPRPCKACQERLALERKQAYEAKLLEWAAKREAAHNYIHMCPVCGKEFTGTAKRVFCSAECRHKWNNIKSSQRKDKRFGHGTRIHWRDLYKEAGSLVCAICGKECDVNDYTISADGTIICGDSYPSVDHIIPWKHGGTDTFDNVQIACRSCNTKKNASCGFAFVDDQLALNI